MPWLLAVVKESLVFSVVSRNVSRIAIPTLVVLFVVSNSPFISYSI